MTRKKRSGIRSRGPKIPYKRSPSTKRRPRSTVPTSRLHLDFKQAMLAAGISGFVTEYKVSYYHVDEAHPDLKLAVEVDGCYWHGCPHCDYRPKKRVKSNDVRKNYRLAGMGWAVLRIRSCAIKADLEGCLDRIRRAMLAIPLGTIQAVLDEDRGGYIKKSDRGKESGPSSQSLALDDDPALNVEP